MATIVYYEGLGREDRTHQCFLVGNPHRMRLIVRSFKDGIAEVYPVGGTMEELADVFVGCFDEKSNFCEELFAVCGYNPKEEFKGIRYETNLAGASSKPVFFLVTKENATKEKIMQEWMDAYEDALERSRHVEGLYKETPEYRAERAKQLKRVARARVVAQEALYVDETTEMEFKDDAAAKEWAEREKLSDDYTRLAMVYACRWAKYMQHLMKKHNKSVAEIAENASRYTSVERTGFLCVFAVYILSRCWKHGEELRKWHNRPFGY